MKWTDEREQIVMECASLGVEAIRQWLLVQTGATTSASAITKHASRMGVSLARFYACPQCGSVYAVTKAEPHRDGLCTLCHYRRLRDAYNNSVRSAVDTQKIIDAKREYDRARKRKSLDVFSADMSEGMSTARSEAQKSFKCFRRNA